MQYFVNKLLYGITILFGVVTLVFFLFNLKPGDPASMLGGQFADATTIANINKELGYDQPLMVRYVRFINDISPISYHQKSNEAEPNFLSEEKYSYVELFGVGDGAVVAKAPYLRRSYQTKRAVTEILRETIPGTALLALTAIIIALVFGVFLGVIAAVNQNKFADQLILFVSVLGLSGPSFFMAIIISWLGGYLWSEVFEVSAIPFGLCLFYMLVYCLYHYPKKSLFLDGVLKALVMSLLVGFGIEYGVERYFDLHYTVSLPGTGLPMTGSFTSIHPFKGEIFTPQNLILPAITLGIRPLAIVVQLMRSSLLDVFRQDYIRTAKAKGASPTRILMKHAIPNALNPVITALSGWFASLLAGAVFIEFVFGWKGIGLEVFEALEREDLPVVLGAVLFFATVFVCINILVDLIYGLLDPRVRA